MSRATKRVERLLPDDKPRYLHLYDNGGETADRYTAVFPQQRTGFCHYLGMGDGPFHPQGICYSGEDDHPIDYPRYSHLGKKITFDDLNPDCQMAVVQEYCNLWNIPVPDKYTPSIRVQVGG